MTTGGKGSRPRPFSVDLETFDNNWDKIFKKEKEMMSKTNTPGGCGCGRSPTGKCIGWHGLSEEEYQEKLAEYRAFNPEQKDQNESN